MTTQTLTPTAMVRNTAGLNVTPLLAAPTQTTLQFTNSGKEVLAVVPSTTGITVLVDIGQTVLGQPVTQPSPVTLTSTDVYLFGPFDRPVDQAGTTTVDVTLSTVTGVTVALLQYPGALT
jgi:hypothetical protein